MHSVNVCRTSRLLMKVYPQTPPSHLGRKGKVKGQENGKACPWSEASIVSIALMNCTSFLTQFLGSLFCPKLEALFSMTVLKEQMPVWDCQATSCACACPDSPSMRTAASDSEPCSTCSCEEPTIQFDWPGKRHKDCRCTQFNKHFSSHDASKNVTIRFKLGTFLTFPAMAYQHQVPRLVFFFS